MTKENDWQIGKNVPITLVGAILLQTVALVWYVSNLDSAIKANSLQIGKNEAKLEVLENIVQDQAVMLARIDENLGTIQEHVEIMVNTLKAEE